MSVERTVAINHRPPSLRGKYGITITPLDQGFANVTEIASDQELTALLLDLEYSRAEADDIIRELELVGTKLKHQRLFDPSKLKAHNFHHGVRTRTTRKEQVKAKAGSDWLTGACLDTSVRRLHSKPR